MGFENISASTKTIHRQDESSGSPRQPAAGGQPPRRNKRGVVLILAAVGAFAMVGILGLAFDLGRMFVAKSELQNYTDAAAIGAALKLDGTSAGVTRATTSATNDVNQWGFGTESVGSVTVKYAQGLASAYVPNPAPALDYRFVQVEAEQNVPLYFMPLVPGVGWQRSVAASSIAGQKFEPDMKDGIFPYSPDAHDPADPNFGFLLGKYYTLKWDQYTGNPSETQFYKLSIDNAKLVGCEADMSNGAFQPGEAQGSQRGYIDLSDRNPLDSGGGAALIRDAILTRTSFELPIVPYSYYIDPEPGQKQTELAAMADRVAEDTDPTTPTYYTTPQTAPNTPSIEDMRTLYRTAYNTVDLPRPPNANGRRMVVAPVNNPGAAGLVIGFAGFLLPPNPCADVTLGSKTYSPCCGEFIGSVTGIGGGGSGGAGSATGSYRIVLFQ